MDDIVRSLLSIEGLVGFEGDHRDSPLYHYILGIYYSKYRELILEKPSLRPTLLGPVFVSRFLSKDLLSSEINKMITERIKSDEGVTYSYLDPFQSEKVILPLSSTLTPRLF